MDRRFQEVNHESQENKVQTLSHEPLQKTPDPSYLYNRSGTRMGVKLKQALVYTPKPKYQFYPRGNIKDRRDLGRGWIFWTPLPLSKRQFKQRLCQFQGREGSF